MEFRFAKRMSRLNASDVRELLKLTAKPEIISLGGGLPAPELFPIEDIKAANAAVLDEMGKAALQYATTEGFAPLRRWIADRMNSTQGTNHTEDSILIMSGSQQALDFTGKVFLDEGDVVLCESPTYLSALGAFRAYECDFVAVPTDDEGMIMPELEKALQENPKAKLIYVIPTFQNPSGITWTLERRKGLVELAKKYNILIVEDNPYGELRYDGENLPSLASMYENVLYLGTFSKIFCPGYRIGWVAGPNEVLEKFVLVKQGADLQSNSFTQMALYKYLEMFDIDAHIEKIRETYRRRRDIAVETLDKNLPAGVRFTRPQGGLFLWIELPEYINARELLMDCLKQNVAFVAGNSFFPHSGVTNTLRLNFSYVSEEKLVIGLTCIANCIKAKMK